MKKILILNAHPYEKSFCNAISQYYYQGAKEGGFEVKIINLRSLQFDPVLHGGYSEKTELEEDLMQQQYLINWSDHLVIITPIWWASVPALLKGYFDRVLLPGFAFKYGEKSPIPEKLLDGRSATVIYTQGAPFWYSFFLTGDCFWNALKKGVLEFCGFKPVKRVVFDSIQQSTAKKRKQWLTKAYNMGIKGN